MAEETELRLYGEIGPSFFGMIDDVSVIRALDELRDSRKIHVRLNSPGGDYFMGTSIANAIRRHPAKVIIHVDALAASAASLIAMGGDRIIMHAGSLMMIHRAWTFAAGNSEELAKVSETLAKVDAGLVGQYQRTGLDKAKLRSLIDAETWMDGDEAVQLGFADEVDSHATDAQAKVPEGWYSRTPDKVSKYTLAASARSVPSFTIAAKANPADVARKAHWEKLKTQLRAA